jgi:hypothetical protein
VRLGDDELVVTPVIANLDETENASEKKRNFAMHLGRGVSDVT